ncbi:MBL fold metallo-hydrolase [Ectothiorhodospiraceae bacterium 2226]|nr:MBL fold metallo-hydrolase [Ectothiorhodospiraceae bacterium 2226]
MVRARSALILLLIAVSPAALAERILPAPEQLSERVWAWIGPYGGPTQENRGFRMNLLYVVGDDAVAVLDTGYTEAMAQEMLAAIRARTDRPIRYAVNTNSQAARHMGNDVFRDAGAEIVAHRDALPRLTGEAQNFAGAVERTLGLAADSVQPPAPPTEVVDGPAKLDLGGVTLELLPAGHAHTPGSLVVNIAEQGLVYAGDVLYGERLLSILPGVSDVAGWIAAYEGLRAHTGASFVPGHGKPGPLEKFEHPVHGYLTALREHMDAQVDMGVDMQSAIESFDASPWAPLENFEDLHARNAHAAYVQSEEAAFGN